MRLPPQVELPCVVIIRRYLLSGLCTTLSSDNACPDLSRSSIFTLACETEELMLSLNEEIQLHFRHASYKDATVASKLLLTTWRQHQHIIM